MEDVTLVKNPDGTLSVWVTSSSVDWSQIPTTDVGYERGQGVRVNDASDPDFEREGPVWRDQKHGEYVDVWFEDGRRQFRPDQVERALRPNGKRWYRTPDEMDALPDPGVRKA